MRDRTSLDVTRFESTFQVTTRYSSDETYRLNRSVRASSLAILQAPTAGADSFQRQSGISRSAASIARMHFSDVRP